MPAMKKIRSTGGETLDDIFKTHEEDIYNQVLYSIRENYKNPSNDNIGVISISTKDIDYSVNLNREKFVPSLEKCISFFELIEEYEKCQECVDIINQLKDKQPIEYDIQ